MSPRARRSPSPSSSSHAPAEKRKREHQPRAAPPRADPAVPAEPAEPPPKRIDGRGQSAASRANLRRGGNAENLIHSPGRPNPPQPTTYTHWLIKAEPESRIERGVDVKFSIDDLEQNRTTTWEGVRNHQAKKFLRDEMKVGHECLFYASNCKEPGIRGIARVCKEGYPDYNAWNPDHPYYDPKSKEENPTWYMVDVEFVHKFPHPVPLALLQILSTHTLSGTLPPSLRPLLTDTHLSLIARSALLKRGRLSVQPVEDGFWEACVRLGENGGWEGWREWEEKRKGGGRSRGKAPAAILAPVETEEERNEMEAKAEEDRDLLLATVTAGAEPSRPQKKRRSGGGDASEVGRSSNKGETGAGAKEADTKADNEHPSVGSSESPRRNPKRRKA